VRLKAVLDFVSNSLDQKLSVQTLARSANISVSQLEWHFSKVFQLTPRDWILSLRLDCACRKVLTEVPKTWEEFSL
jgi:transcriptional regulator GlxA family with amidase domain